MTKRRREILDYIAGYILIHKEPPSWSDVARHFKVHPNYIRQQMKVLAGLGYVKWDKYAPMTLDILRLPDRAA